jgi:crotonobetainyl-CoA:carnitine CoA-transferase CaiB-like acyl-CoA transferase
MEKVGLSYAEVVKLNPRIIYGAVSGYGTEGPWKNRPGQDLLLQSMSGLAYTTGNAKDNPMPFGLAIADNLCGSQLVQGILGALIRRQKTGAGALIEVSLLESLLDFQFELLTTYHSSGKLPKRSKVNNGHPLLNAPYGIYSTADGHIAIAMVDLKQLAKAIGCNEMMAYDQKVAFSLRDEIKSVLAKHLLTQKSAYWLEKLHAKDLWAMEVLDWERLTKLEAYSCLQMEQTITTTHGKEITTTRCPIRINGERIFSPKPAPQLGEHTEAIKKELIGR